MDICPACHKSYGIGKTRKITDTCGHNRCLTCLLQNETCPMCVPDTEKASSTGQDTTGKKASVEDQHEASAPSTSSCQKRRSDIDTEVKEKKSRDDEDDESMSSADDNVDDPIKELTELSLVLTAAVPDFKVTLRRIPPRKEFTAQVLVAGVTGKGTGDSKQMAMEVAAVCCLSMLKKK